MAAKRLRYERDHTRLDMDSVADGPGSVGGAAPVNYVLEVLRDSMTSISSRTRLRA